MTGPAYVDSEGKSHPLELKDARLLHDLLDHYLEQMSDMHKCALDDDIFIKTPEDLVKVTGSLHEETISSKYMMSVLSEDARKVDAL